MSDSPREPASPLVPLAWGFVALFPLPLVAMLFTQPEQELERKIEYVMAAILLFAAALLFAIDVRAQRRRRRDEPPAEPEE